jgi:uncharacterized membrane protein YcaP (DUF421 family)
MDSTILFTILRGIGVFIAALFLSRLMGRELLSQMTFFDFIVGVSMGSLVANAIIGSERSPVSSMVGLITLSLLSIATSFLYIKRFRARKLVNSEPVTIVQNGTIIDENMKNIRLTIDELMMKLREKNAFNLADVEFAIMETDGQLSVLPKADKQPLTPYHMNIKSTTSAGLTRDIIMDGTVMEENLSGAGFDRKWLDKQLKSQSIMDVSEVFYAGLDSNNKLHISRKSNKTESHGQYGIE